MYKTKILLQLLVQELHSFAAILDILILSICYIFLSLIAIGFRPIVNILSGGYSSLKTVQILAQFMFELINLTFTPIALILFFCTAILFSFNIYLLLQRLRFLSTQRNVKLTIGVGIVSIAVNGCSACGLSILYVLGLSGALFSIHGTTLSLISVGILLATLFYNLDAVNKSCPLPVRKSP